MDLIALRAKLRPLIIEITVGKGHKDLDDFCVLLGLPKTPKEGSKREKISHCFDSITNEVMASVAKQLLEGVKLGGADRNAIQDLLWMEYDGPDFPKKTRRELARSLSFPLFQDSAEFLKLLETLWILDDEPLDILLGESCRSLRSRIERHVFRNPDDWDAETLFVELGGLDASNQRFVLFIEGLASAEVLTDEAAQNQFVIRANETLVRCGAELRETAVAGGYPVFKVVRTQRGTATTPKNLIFASSTKPDLRLSNALDNDVEIVGNAESVLIYDRKIGEGGLPWTQLLAWWSETKGITDREEAKKSLYKRLKSCLPPSSPPQLNFYDAFHKCFGRDVPNLPALLPEVWFHWDPKTVQERGADALLRFRMDFLMLLPNGVRVVLEIDGKHHFADSDGRANAQRYADMVKADRELKLVGYEVFRFGAKELGDKAQAESVVTDFFQSLFDRHHLKYSSIPSAIVS